VRITYRRWELNDAKSICRLLHDTWFDTYTTIIPHEDILDYLDEHYNEEKVRSFFDDQNIVGFVAEVDDVLAGYEKTLYAREEKRLYVQQLYILPQYQRLGIGKQLMAFAAEHAKTYDLDRVWLGVMVDNSAALLWYQNLGYQIIEKAPFTLGKTTVEHYIGYVPAADIIQQSEKKY
jgi:diamine N-acetyltransferase